jgi:hypothetical protein
LPRLFFCTNYSRQDAAPTRTIRIQKLNIEHRTFNIELRYAFGDQFEKTKFIGR